MSERSVREALVALGATEYRDEYGHVVFLFSRCEDHVCPILAGEGDKRLFIGECKAYLREKGMVQECVFVREADYRLRIHIGDSDRWGKDFEAPTEHEAWAKAVLSASEGEG